MITNPKALNIDGINFAGSKLTVGFKCKPEKKYLLAIEAMTLGLTLSEHIENIIMNVENLERNFYEEIESKNIIINEQKKKINALKENISFYENDFLQKVFKEYESKSIVYKNALGEEVEIKINDIKDVFTVLINSVKL